MEYWTLAQRVEDAEQAAMESKLARGDWTPGTAGEGYGRTKGALSTHVRVDHERGLHVVELFPGDSVDLDEALESRRQFLDQTRTELIALIQAR